MLFYADDCAIMGEDPEEVQLLLDLLIAHVGLKMNTDKTKCIIMD
jgi:hypothetical protein